MNEKILGAGLSWLYDTVQPEGALITHHGITLPGEGNRRFSFIPRAWEGYVVIVVEVAKVEYAKGADGYNRPANPLEVDELNRLREWVRGRGHEVVHAWNGQWNGHPWTSGSLALARPPHPTLLAAQKRYSDGCPDHPAERVFCECGWYQRGADKLVMPEGV